MRPAPGLLPTEPNRVDPPEPLSPPCAEMARVAAITLYWGDIMGDRLMGALYMLRAVVFVLLIALLPAHARAEAHIALLIGNEAYSSEIGRLANPHNDVALLEGALKGLDFEVVTVRDAGLGALTRAVNAYARRVQAAGPNAVGFFYYSGHGASDGSTNYLIPVDVKTSETGALWDESLRLTEITRKLKVEAGNATHFVVFDACRNTLKLTQPGSRAVVQSKGFVPIAQENGMLIAYATAEGELASDVGVGAGPYAQVLAEEIVKPGIEAVVMFRAVQRRVRAANHQEPYLGFNALGDVYLAGKGEQPTAAPSTTQSDWSAAEREWQRYGNNTKDIRLLEAFKEKHKGDPLYARLAEARIEELKKQQDAPPLPAPVQEKARPAAAIVPSNCEGNTNALGTARTVSVDTTGGPGFGFEQYKAHDFLLAKEVVLTFDDGPWPVNTRLVLDALAHHCVKATFFPIGKHALWHPEILKEVAAAGHTIGGHTWSHANLRKLTGDKAIAEIEKGFSAVRLALGTPPASYFRFPFLSDTPELLTYLGSRNVAIISDDLDSFDFKMNKPEDVINSVMSKLERKGKGIILMHDFQQATAKAAPALLDGLKAKGYRIVHMQPMNRVETFAQWDEVARGEIKGLVQDRPTSSVVHESR
jgi:peptidoglycan-N-acetylglucosamine deacetylase